MENKISPMHRRYLSPVLKSFENLLGEFGLTVLQLEPPSAFDGKNY
jgi:hypothetical protein